MKREPPQILAGVFSARGGARTHTEKLHTVLSRACKPIPAPGLYKEILSEAREGFEPSNNGFADRRVRPLRHRAFLYPPYLLFFHQIGN